MKRFAVFLISFALSSSVSFTRPFEGVVVRDINVCNFASAVAINATGAAYAINQIDVPLDNNWADITHVGNDPQLSISSVAWPGFPQVNCEFQGVDTVPVLNNGITTDSQVIFQTFAKLSKPPAARRGEATYKASPSSLREG
ncbi:hypothetical protein B0O99DRAFT_602128 [Bisporella sp. PMI_857]|nr:hypothetical protein B0O99DRAFT_602128 [Bisporella sp. PMI_857]